MKSKILAFSGIDGAGKTTHIQRCQEHLENCATKFITIRVRGGYTPGFESLKQLLRCLAKKKLPSSGQSEKRTQYFKNPFIKMLWKNLAILDIGILSIIYFRWKKLCGYTILIDRYLVDSRIDFQVNLNMENIENSLSWKLLELFSVAPDAHFLLYLPLNESIRRCIDKNDPFMDSFEIKNTRQLEYENFLKKDKGIIKIDSSKKFEENTAEIIKQLPI